MSASTIEFTVDDDSDIKKYVRGVTFYDDTRNELPEAKLETQIELAKNRLSVKYGIGSTDYFNDDNLAQALIYGTAIYCKGAVENYSVGSWDFGDERIESHDIPPEESIQLNQWANAVDDALDNSDSVQNNTGGPRPTFAPDFSYDDRRCW